MSLAIVPTGTANIASVVSAFVRLGEDPQVTSNVETVRSAGQVVVPGVGSFHAAAKTLDSEGLREVIVDRVGEGRPTLLICVGMQLLCSRSEESPTAAGLGVISSTIRRFTGSHPVPQMGWNRVRPERESRFFTTGWAYFANSYRLAEIPAGWHGATADYAGSFVADIERGDVVACQFHPELSGPWGEAMLSDWLHATRGR